MLTIRDAAATQIDYSLEAIHERSRVYQALYHYGNNTLPLYRKWTSESMPSRETYASRDWTKLIIVFIGSPSLLVLKDLAPVYYQVLDVFCQLTDYDITKICFYSTKSAVTGGERRRSGRDPDAFYCIFDLSHGDWSRSNGPYISEGNDGLDFLPTSEWLHDLEELDRDILFIVIPICWSAKSRKVLLLSDRVKYVFGPDAFQIDNGGYEFQHRMKALILHFEETLA